MCFRLVSDLHIEFFLSYNQKFELPQLDTDKNDVLVLAGDIGLAEKPNTYVPYIEQWSQQFEKVIYVYGNHEYYRSSFIIAHDKIKQQLEHLPNVFFGSDFIVRHNNVVFICSTLWTDFQNHNPIAMQAAQFGMSDYKLIRTGFKIDPYERKLNPTDTYLSHIHSVSFIKHAVEANKSPNTHIVVVTHHAPSTKSIHPMYQNDLLNGAFVSALESNILDWNVDIICHGHVHHSTAYEIGETAIICNSHGYVNEKNPNFNPTLRFTFDQ